MKRVETININGIVFNIDDDAYGKLGSYLDVLGKYFENEQGGREIIADIEARISELFAERDGDVSRVVTIADVSKVIETLGAPEDIAGADVDAEKEPQQPPKPMRRLYRDPDHSFLGGVCAGLGAWIGIKPIIIRLILILLFILPFKFLRFNIFDIYSSIITGGNSFLVLIYVLLWIIIPKAKTTAQKLEMRGEPVTIDNIEKNIKESFSDPLLQKSFRNFQNEAGEVFTKIFGIIGRLIGIFLGLFMLFCGIVMAVGMIGLVSMQDIIFKREVEWDFLSFTELLQNIISPASYVILLVCAITAASLFLLALMFWGAKLITGFKVRHKLLHVALAVLFLATIFAVLSVSASQALNFRWYNEIAETRQIAPSDTLYLALSPSQLQISNNPMEISFDKDNNRFYGKPKIDVRKSNDGSITMRIKRASQGESKPAAFRYAEDIEYSVEVRDSSLIFDRYFTVVPQDKWKFQRVTVTLYVPVGTVVFTDCHESNGRLWYLWRSNGNCTWIMTENRGLQRIENRR